MNLELAKKRLEEYQHYVNLTESYEAKDFRTSCIKYYAITGSIPKCVEKLNELGFSVNGNPVERNDIIAVINSNPSRNDDELLRIVRKNYRKKIPH